jgi:hypothetical protein
VLFAHVFFNLAVTVYCLIHTYKRRSKITCMTGMMIAMITAMMSSFQAGLILGIMYHSQLELSSIVAVMLGLIVGFVAGKPISLMAGMDGMAAGIMGGFMGAMLGVMLTNPALMIWFFDSVFILMFITIFLLIREEENLYENWKSQPNDNSTELKERIIN